MKFTKSTKRQWLQHWKTNYQWLLMDQIEFYYHKKLNQRPSKKKKERERNSVSMAESSSVLKRLYAYHSILISSWGLYSKVDPLNSDLSVHGENWQPFNIIISIWDSYKEESGGGQQQWSPIKKSVHMMWGTCKDSWRHLMVWMQNGCMPLNLLLIRSHRAK